MFFIQLSKLISLLTKNLSGCKIRRFNSNESLYNGFDLLDTPWMILMKILLILFDPILNFNYLI